MNVALVYDRVNKWGGAERVLLALHEIFPHAPLFTSVYNPETASWAKMFNIETSFLQHLPFAKYAHERYPLLMPLAFESFSFDEYDLVISVTSEAAKGIITKPQTRHVCYCLTPTRYLWSGYDTYFANPLLRIVSAPAVAYLRSWDTMAAARPDHFIAISEEVRGRIQRYYHRNADVIYPPVSLYEGEKPANNKKSYYLVVSRLVPYKRVDLAVAACNALGLPLKIIGEGSERKRLQAFAGPTVEFIGSVSDQELKRYYKGAKALLFPGFEDFGITMAEALGFGIPVIAFNGGGAREIVKDGVTGILFAAQTEQALIQALQQFEREKLASVSELHRQAERFSQTRFQDAFKANLHRLFSNLTF